MHTSTPPTIPSPSEGLNPRPASRIPLREELRQVDRRLLKRGKTYKADLWVVDLGEGPMVIKDFAAKPAWVRLIGRFLIERELRAYRWLGELPGLPRLIGRIDGLALAIEKLEARPLGVAEDRTTNGALKLARLREIVDRLHAAGLAHLDLRARRNVLVGAGDRIWVVDLQSAIWVRPGSLAHRLFFGRLARVDESAYLKWKQTLEAGPYTPQELTLVRRNRIWRRFWIFNRPWTR